MAGNLKHAIVAVILLATAGCATSPASRLGATVDRQHQADQAYVQGNLAGALSGYQSLTHAMPQNADFWFRLGNIYARLDRSDEAVDAYRHTLSIEPGHAKAWHNLGIIRLREAEAAFARSASAAAGIDDGLQKESADKARDIAALRSAAKPDDAAAPGDNPPAPRGTGAASVESRP
ncbi:MAG: hypothetical protein BGP10_08295 [Rhodanobacter sp. 68-29]|nr:tetratricopeptide repeat protein [Rhodanobacter sp.]ODU75720.1 MAG: hypothetical protein ABT17_03130 [Rhodanobacter sp. SCN 69-32]OJY57007.1 MAG: hypothetical protein BGP10_08295 [Rhodanobacter sp. 68-29]